MSWRVDNDVCWSTSLRWASPDKRSGAACGVESPGVEYVRRSGL